MKEYTFCENSAKLAMKSMILSQVILRLIGSIGAVSLAFVINEKLLYDLFYLFIICTALVVFNIIPIILEYKKGIKNLLKYKYILSETEIILFISENESIKLELNKIDDHKILRKGLLLKSSSDKILIFKELDNYNELSSLIIGKLKS